MEQEKEFCSQITKIAPNGELQQLLEYLENGTKAAVTELIQVGEKVSGDLQSTQFEEEVVGVGGVGFSVRSGGGSAAFECPLQASKEIGKEAHQMHKVIQWPISSSRFEDRRRRMRGR